MNWAFIILEEIIVSCGNYDQMHIRSEGTMPPFAPMRCLP